MMAMSRSKLQITLEIMGLSAQEDNLLTNQKKILHTTFLTNSILVLSVLLQLNMDKQTHLYPCQSSRLLQLHMDK